MRKRHKLYYDVTTFSHKHSIWYVPRMGRWFLDQDIPRDYLKSTGNGEYYSITNKSCRTFSRAKKEVRRIAELLNWDLSDCEIVIIRFFRKKGKRYQQEFYYGQRGDYNKQYE